MNDMDLLKAVRVELLQLRAQGAVGFGLSAIVAAVSPTRFVQSYTTNAQCLTNKRTRFTSGGLKTYRGRVQQCLARLAVKGLLYTRRGPEGGVASYEHGETDKRFRFRITQSQAIQDLHRLGLAVRATEPISAYFTDSLRGS